MTLMLLVLTALVTAPDAAPQRTLPPSFERPIAVEMGGGVTRRGGPLDLVLPVGNDDASAAEKGLSEDLEDKPWLRLVRQEGEVAAVVRGCQRSVSSESRSRDGKKTTTTYRYRVRVSVAIRGETGDLESEALVSHSYSGGSTRMFPTTSEDLSAYRRAGQAMAPKVREWILPRIAALRPDGPDAGFQHRVVHKWLIRGDGLEVTGVAAGGPAARAGLQVGDRIRRIDGEGGTNDMDERVRAWRLEKAGTRVTLEIERGGQRQTIAVELTGAQRQ